MEMYAFRREEYDRLYNCTFYNITMVPLEERQHTGMGAFFICIMLFFEILYIPCSIAIWKHRENSCYKIMFYIAVNDMCCMWFNGFLTGYFAILGVVFCSHPTFIYICGNTALALWASETVAEVTLAFNRCVAICSPKWERILFRGYKTWLWMLIPTLYALYWWCYTMPILYSGIYMSWFFNPHVGYFDDFGLTYDNPVHVNHNYFVIVGLTATYSTFAIMLFLKSKKISASGGQGTNQAQQNYSQKMIFIQVVMISMINAVAAAIYVYQQFFRITQEIIYLGQFTWLLAHGIPPVIYLAMNKTLRKDTVRMLIGCLGAIDPQALSNHRHSDHGNGNNAVPAVTKSSTTQAWSNNSTIGAGVHGH
ncbi:CRE-SRT-23 protein [Aphelenchoides avenae]|nr:CRE-SRT-23 protein [Aphelenchus avenae]